MGQQDQRFLTQTTTLRGGLAEALAGVDWITPEGSIDPSKFPIESVLRQSLDPNIETFRSACVLLGSMASCGRTDAGVYLLGLLRNYEHDLRRLETMMDGLGAFKDDACVAALFHELCRVKSSNATRRYLEKVIATLARFPLPMVQEGFSALAGDPSFSYRMRAKFARAMESLEYQ